MPREKPLDRRQGAVRSVMRVHSAATGKRVSGTKLASDPILDGIAAAHGRLFVSIENETLVCLGEQGTAGAGPRACADTGDRR